MADKKVSELTEETNLNNIQAVGVKNVEGTVTPCRYNLGRVEEKVTSVLNGILKDDDNSDFSSSVNYYTGQFCSHDGNLYKFIKPHPAGSWSSSDVIQTSYSAELNAIMSNDFETLSAIVDFKNADGTRASDADTLRTGKMVEAYFDWGGQCTQTTDSNGLTVFTIKKGNHFTISTQQVSGYSAPCSQEFTASISTSSDGTTTYGGRIVYLDYVKGVAIGTDEQIRQGIIYDKDYKDGHPVTYPNSCTVTAHIRINGSYSTKTEAYNGQTASLVYKMGEYDKLSKLPAINTNITYSSETSSAYAIFNGVKPGEYCTVYIPNMTGYEQVGTETLTSAYVYDNKGFFASGNSCETFIDVTYGNNYGIFYLCGDNLDPDESKRTPENARWREFRLSDYPGYGRSDWSSVSAEYIAMYPCSAIHIKLPELAQYNADYYVMTQDLTTQRTVVSKAWSLANYEHPHVTKNYYDINKPTTNPRTAYGANGSLATAYMMYDSNRRYGSSSPAAEWAVSRNFPMYKGSTNERILHGFIGTRDQWQPLLDAYSQIDVALKFFGYTGQNYRTGTTWWTSCQSSATLAWPWYSSGSWSYLNYKTSSAYVLPFFAI